MRGEPLTDWHVVGPAGHHYDLKEFLEKVGFEEDDIEAALRGLTKR